MARQAGGPHILAREMHEAGLAFFVTPNGVWLTDAVPPEYIDFP